VYSKEELAGLAEVFRKHPNIYIISDEIYEYINFVGKHESIAQFDDLKDHIVLINGLSKGFAMTGWRLGYTASSIPVAKAMEKLQGQFTSGTCSITQKAGVVALTTDLRPTYEMSEEFARRRKKVLELVKDIRVLNAVRQKVHSIFSRMFLLTMVKAMVKTLSKTQQISPCIC
jgi:aspartate aminotransferase